MARRLVTLDICDDCTHNKIPNVPAVGQHVLSIDGQPLRRVQLCMRCEVIWEPFIAVYEQQGQDVEPPPSETPPKKAAKKRRPRAVPADKPKELEKAPAEPAPDKRHLLVWCPEPHPTKNGHGTPVSYETRNTHAENVHNGAKVWEIKWGDPEGILKARCESHAECMKTGLSFTSKQGLAQHQRSCQLPRVDQGSSEEDTSDSLTNDETEGRPTEDR